MLGRHSYRVHRVDDGWTVSKEGEAGARGGYAQREAAIAEAVRLAEADKPSRITIDDGDGIILEERLFGTTPGEDPAA